MIPLCILFGRKRTSPGYSMSCICRVRRKPYILQHRISTFTSISGPFFLISVLEHTHPPEHMVVFSESFMCHDNTKVVLAALMTAE